MTKITEEEMDAELLRQKKGGGWGAEVNLRDGPMRRALRKAGWIDTFTRPNNKRIWFKISAVGLERLVNVPGSGITRR